jgi:hypothetical protein
MDTKKLRTLLFRPLSVFLISVTSTILFMIAIVVLSHGKKSFFSLYYVAPIGIPFVAFIFDRAERANRFSKKQIYIDSIIVVASLLRTEFPIPFYSGHSLFLTYAMLTSKTWVAQLTAIAVMLQVLYLKIFVWHDYEVFGGIALGVIAAIVFLHQRRLKSAHNVNYYPDELQTNIRRVSKKTMDTKLKIGDSVVVKQGFKDEELETDLSGWQGRIIDIREADDENEILIDIAWDNITLRNMPKSYIEESEEEGMDWTEYALYASDLELTQSRDTETNVKDSKEEINECVRFLSWGEQGKRINKILSGYDENEFLYAWGEYLDDNLAFPFEAEISPDADDRGPLKTGDKVIVHGIEDVDDLYGIIVELRRGREKFHFPLCDIEPKSKDDATNQIVMDYVVWFANR